MTDRPTHVDQDHLGGLVPLIANYRVSQVIESPLMPENALCQAWREALYEAQITPVLADRGMEIHLDERTRLQILHPRKDHLLSDDANANSIVIRLEMDQFEMLLTADIDQDAEAYLVASHAPLGVDVLKVAHHGAKTSSSQRFIDQVAPTVALISVGDDNPFGHPHEQVLATLDDAGCQVLRTDQVGTIECVSDGKQLWIHTQR